jgi:hypothetical protein
MGWRNVARVNVFVRPLIPDVDYVNASYRPKSLSRLRRKSGPPKVLEARGRQFRVAHRVLDVAVSEVSLQGPRVMPSVRQRVPTGVPEHVRVGLEAKPRLDASPLDHPREPCRGERRSALRRKDEGRLGLLFALSPPQCP